jgi:hypothetical protein
MKAWRRSHSQNEALQPLPPVVPPWLTGESLEGGLVRAVWDMTGPGVVSATVEINYDGEGWEEIVAFYAVISSQIVPREGGEWATASIRAWGNDASLHQVGPIKQVDGLVYIPGG